MPVFNNPGTVGALGPIKPFEFYVPSFNVPPPTVFNIWDDDGMPHLPFGLFDYYSTMNESMYISDGFLPIIPVTVWESELNPSFDNSITQGFLSSSVPAPGDNLEGFFIGNAPTATDVILMGYSGYNTLPVTRDPDGWTQHLPVIMGWDTDAEAQLSNPPYFLDTTVADYVFPPIVKTNIPTFVQVNGAVGTSGPVDVQIAPQDGNVLVISISLGSSSAFVSSIVDNLGNSIYQIDGNLNIAFIRNQIFWGFVKGSPTKITVTVGGSPVFITVIVAEYSGVVVDGVTTSKALHASGSISLDLQLADNNNIQVVGTTARNINFPTTFGTDQILRLQVDDGTNNLSSFLIDSTVTLAHVTDTVSLTFNVSSGDSVVNAIELRSISPEGAIDLDTENQLQQPDWNKDHLTEEAVRLINLILAWDTDAENQIQQPEWYKDHLIDEAIRNPALINVVLGWDTDADEQLNQIQLNPLNYNYQQTEDDWASRNFGVSLSATDIILMSYYGYSIYPTGKDTPTEWTQFTPVIPTINLGYDHTDNYQLQWIDWNKDHLLDNEVEKITLFITAYDNDAEQQLLQPDYNFERDITEAGIEQITLAATVDFTWDIDLDSRQWIDYILDTNAFNPGIENFFIPVVAYDHTADNQLQQPEWYKDHLTDEQVEKITLPITAYDNDAEQQSMWILNFGQDTILDASVELIQLNTGVSKVYDDIQDKMWVDYSLDYVDDRSQLTTITVPDEMQYFPWPIQLQDQHVDHNQLPIIPLSAYDPDQQSIIAQQFTIVNGILDEDVERIQVVVAITDFTWDNDSDQQMSQLPYYVDDSIETIIERIVIPQVISQDLDQQFNTGTWFNTDNLFDADVERIQVVAAITDFTWDNDSEQQFLQAAIFMDHVMERSELIMLPPFINIVEIVIEEEE